MTKSADKLTADIFQSVQKSGLILSDNAKVEIRSCVDLYLEIIGNKNSTDEEILEAIETMKAVVTNWSWDGSPAVAASFWSEALKAVAPLGKELLTMAVKAAVKEATGRLLS